MFPDSFSQVNDAKLSADVARMITGPGRTSLGPAETAALVALNRAVAAESPFIIVLRIEPRDGGAFVITGEVSPDASVVIVDGTRRTPATIDGFTWRALVDRLPPESAAAEATDPRGAVRAPLRPGASSHDSPRE